MKVKNCVLIKAISCGLDTSVLNVAKLLKENKQRRIIIIDDKEFPLGIISTTDINNKVVAENKNPESLKAKDIMNKLYLICDYDEDLCKIYTKMLEHKSFFVPVINENKLYAILTYGELFEHIKQIMKNVKN